MNEPERIRFKYVFSDDYNPVYANGVIGGVTPHGEVLMHFYQERHAIPKIATHKIVDGRLGEEIETDEDPVAIRFIQAGITMTPAAARALHEWLGNVLATLESASTQKGNEEGGE